jgi:hypothetical protein
MTTDAQNDLIASAGKIHLLNLSALKENLGSKWERMSAHVQQFFEAAIKRSLMPGDTFCRHEEFSYLIMFRELSVVEAELKCAAISDEVCRRLFGENGAEVSMRNLIAHVGLNTVPADAKQKASLDALLEREGKEVVITRRDESGSISSDTKPVRLTMGNNSLSRAFAPEIEYVYRPIWDSINHVVLTYLCQPMVPGLLSNAMTDFCTAEDDDDQATLDLHVLRECLERGRRLRTAGLRVILAVPIHFTTVARARSWRAYSETLRQIDEEVRRDLAPVVFGIDYGVPHVRLAQELPKLSRMSYRVFCVVDRCQGAGARFVKSAAHGVGITFDEKEDEPISAMRLRELAKETQSATVESLALGLRSTSLALAAISAGIRYLEGPVIRPAVTDPRHGFAHDVEDMYKTKRLRAAS